MNISREEAQKLKERWQTDLDRLNETDKSMFCSMACGLSYGSGDYDYEKLYEQADKLMYENKKSLKANNITSHITQQTV